MLNKYDPNAVVPQVGDVLVRKPEVSELLARVGLAQVTMIEMTDQGTLVYIERCNGLDDIKIGMWYESALAYYDFYRDANWKESERPTAKEDETMLNKYDPSNSRICEGDVLMRKNTAHPGLDKKLIIKRTEYDVALQRNLGCGIIVYSYGASSMKAFCNTSKELVKYYDFCTPEAESQRPTAQEDENPTPPPLSFVEWLYQDQLAAARGRPSQATVTPQKPDYHRKVNGRVELADALDRECAQRKDEAQVFVDAAQGKDFTAYHTMRADGTYVKLHWGKTEELRYKGAAIQNALIDWNRQCM